MPTDQVHVIAYAVSLAVVGLIGVGAFVYILRTTPKRKPRAEQLPFDFPPSPPKPASASVQAPPMAGV